MINIQSKAIPATGLAAAAAVGIALATCAPAAAAPNLVGAGCSDYAAMHPDGPASVSGMSQDPVAVAASNNPMLTTLTQAVSGQLNPQVNLVDTLNSGQYTVFAPTDAAFSKLPAATASRPWSPHKAIMWVPTRPLVVRPQTKNVPASSQKSR